MELKTGTRWRSTVCSTEVIVIRAPSSPVALWCGGRPMAPVAGDGPAAPAAEVDSPPPGVQLGKRYEHADSGLEVLCTKAGAGPLSLEGALLLPKEAKPLPSSD
jgi:hypothetical protein